MTDEATTDNPTSDTGSESTSLVVSLIDTETKDISTYEVETTPGEAHEEAAVRVLDREEQAQAKSFLVEDIKENA